MSKGSKFRLWFGRLFKTGLILGLLGFITLAAFVMVARSELPGFEDLKESPNGQMIRVRAADGSVIQTLGPSFGEWTSYEDTPEIMREAMVAVEDRRFYYHIGLDPIGMGRAAYLAIANRGTDKRLQGASTITQQLARTVFLNNKYTVGRKLREMVLALALETKFSKEEILELYLNKVYFGGGAYGIDSASRLFFDHSAQQITLPEAAIIAGLVKAPSNYSPTADAEAALGRAKVVVGVMQDAGVITAQEASNVKLKAVKLAPTPPQNSVRYFTDWALEGLPGMIDETMKPIDVWTTLDLSMQRSATAAIQTYAPRGAQGALVAIDRDGAVRAMVGGTDYRTSNYNRAVTAVRQPGSAWKVFVYMAALQADIRPEDKVVDEPVEIDGWAPKNSGGRYAGEIDLRTAFAYSKNTVAAQIGNQVGTSTIAGLARQYGITTPINTQPSMVLGTSEARVVDMTRAFASIAAMGKSVTPYGISKITTIDGGVLYQHKPPKSVQLVEPHVAAGIVDLMLSAVNIGTGRAAQIGRPVAGKTGTTSSNKDGWFLGFSSGLTTGVWMGRDDAKAVGGLEGGRAPAQAFAAFMKQAVAKRPVEKFAVNVTYPERLDEEGIEFFEEGLGPDMIDENGAPIEGMADPDGAVIIDDGGTVDVDPGFIDRALGRSSSAPPAKTTSKAPPAKQVPKAKQNEPVPR
ncbi:penicillin-binding protein [Sphingorhabdus lutea]|uniref:Penicillin-binding protein n=1 Tax=Sphingorhabdus lutea TaxID=1913578 RepID=A0A1L3J9M5_9SPHN|nr:PBP1A family penicillin-binding protein [Sphingorhabdus lutea]APG61811.1 penicillin-binding protein [Sphingorhabdus lutea]